MTERFFTYSPAGDFLDLAIRFELADLHASEVESLTNECSAIIRLSSESPQGRRSPCLLKLMQGQLPGSNEDVTA